MSSVLGLVLSQEALQQHFSVLSDGFLQLTAPLDRGFPSVMRNSESLFLQASCDETFKYFVRAQEEKVWWQRLCKILFSTATPGVLQEPNVRGPGHHIKRKPVTAQAVLLAEHTAVPASDRLSAFSPLLWLLYRRI